MNAGSDGSKGIRERYAVTVKTSAFAARFEEKYLHLPAVRLTEAARSPTNSALVRLVAAKPIRNGTARILLIANVLCRYTAAARHRIPAVTVDPDRLRTELERAC